MSDGERVCALLRPERLNAGSWTHIACAEFEPLPSYAVCVEARGARVLCSYVFAVCRKLDLLVDKTESLQDTAFNFRREARRLRRTMWWRVSG